MLARKPRMLAAIALANKMARSILGDDNEERELQGFRSGCGNSKALSCGEGGSSACEEVSER